LFNHSPRSPDSPCRSFLVLIVLRLFLIFRFRSHGPFAGLFPASSVTFSSLLPHHRVSRRPFLADWLLSFPHLRLCFSLFSRANGYWTAPSSSPFLRGGARGFLVGLRLRLVSQPWGIRSSWALEAFVVRAFVSFRRIAYLACSNRFPVGGVFGDRALANARSHPF